MKASSDSQMGGCTFTHSLVEKGTAGPPGGCAQGLLGAVLRPGVNNQGFGEAGFVVARGWSASWLQ